MVVANAGILGMGTRYLWLESKLEEWSLGVGGGKRRGSPSSEGVLRSLSVFLSFPVYSEAWVVVVVCRGKQRNLQLKSRNWKKRRLD